MEGNLAEYMRLKEELKSIQMQVKRLNLDVSTGSEESSMSLGDEQDKVIYSQLDEKE